MPRCIPPAITALLVATAAFAHDAPLTHAHPHGDWSLAVTALLGAVVLGALFLLPRRAARSARSKLRDPR